MITVDFLEKCGFKAEDISKLMEWDEKHRCVILPMAEEYMKNRTLTPFASVELDDMLVSYRRAENYAKRVNDRLGQSEHSDIGTLLFWIYCIVELKKDYESLNIPESVFFETVRDVAYKTEEHKKRYGVLGLADHWVCLVFDIHVVAFGRLQFQPSKFSENEYCYGDYHLKKGDRVFSCHIPSSGPLTKDLCMDAFQGAYEFFKDELSSSVIPVVIQSYLTYPPYLNSVFVEGTNTFEFIKMFDVVAERQTEKFGDCHRIFGKDFDGSTEGFPTETGLQRRFVDYIKGGGTFGTGYGVLLFDGETGIIVNT